MYAVIRIRGLVNVTPNKAKALMHLNLSRTNNMSLWQETKEMLEMIKVAEGFVTYGKITDELAAKVIEEKGKMFTEEKDLKKAIAEVKKGKTLNQAGIKNCFHLSPPRKGFERSGTKMPYHMGGALGNRKEAINELIERML